MENLKEYTKAPLPFVGQKRFFLKLFKEKLYDIVPEDGEGWTVIDVFGGSGLLAHVAKRQKPKARVIFNDFDSYSDRLVHVDETNELLDLLRVVLKDVPKGEKIPPEIRKKACDVIRNFQGFKDVSVLLQALLFSSVMVKDIDELLKCEAFYNKMPKNNYSCEGYLNGLEIVKKDFRELIRGFSTQEKVFLILDPPYINNRTTTYKAGFYLKDFLDLVNLVTPPFVFFSNEKSEIMSFCEYAEEDESNYFAQWKGCEIAFVKASPAKNSAYTDCMLSKQ